ncbi:hypothetical protein VPHD260_0177 [Vibrio phage D260]
MVKRIFAMGIADAAKAKPGILLARAMGFNSQGKFVVNGERLEGSKNKWQRYFAKGCPELIEYLTRVDLLMGQDARNFDDYFDSPVPRNKDGEVQMPLSQASSGTEEPSDELKDWVAQLPDWGELYTPKGLNFFILFSLYNIETGDNPNYKQLLRICDSYDSPYRVRFCQGKPQNDPELESHYAGDMLRLTGIMPEAEVAKAPEPAVSSLTLLEQHLGRLVADKEALELEAAWNVIQGMTANNVPFEVTKPTNIAVARRMIQVLEEIGQVGNEIASLEKGYV